MARMSEAANQEQIDYWNDDAGPRWVGAADDMDARIRPMGERAIAALDPQPGERVLDVGCGCGDTSRTLANRVGDSGAVIGVDVSEPMLAIARERGARLAQLSFRLADAQSWRPEQSVDAVFSRFGVMFFANPGRAFTNLHDATQPGGRMAFVCWKSREFNPWMIEPMRAVAHLVDLPDAPDPTEPGPFALGDPDRLTDLLQTGGWTDIELDDVATVMDLGSAHDATQFFMEIGPLAGPSEDLSTEQRDGVRAALTDMLEANATKGRVAMPAGIWVVSARRKSPG